MKKIICFDIWGVYAHFRRIYTTTSPLTYSIPPRTAISGMIGAIIGLSKENNEYLKYFKKEDSKIALRIILPIRKVRIPINLINTKEAMGPGMNIIKTRTQIRFEFLKSPKYRIYFWHKDSCIYERLKKYLINHKSYYTPSLGLSENIANFEYVSESGIEKRDEKGYSSIHSVLPLDKVSLENGIDISKQDREYFKERIPIFMNCERIVQKYSDVLFERNGLNISVKLNCPYYEVSIQKDSDNILFLE